MRWLHLSALVGLTATLTACPPLPEPDPVCCLQEVDGDTRVVVQEDNECNEADPIECRVQVCCGAGADRAFRVASSCTEDDFPEDTPLPAVLPDNQCGLVDCSPDSAPFSSAPAKAAVLFDMEQWTCSTATGEPDPDNFHLNYAPNNETTGAGEGYQVVSITAGSFSNGGAFYSLSEIPEIEYVTVVLEQNSDAAQVVLGFSIDGTVPALTGTQMQFP